MVTCSAFFMHMKEYAERFYKSKQWQRCRAAYIASVGGLCERCRMRGIINVGVIVHHRKYVDPENITDPAVLTAFDNLELLCKDCHNKEHFAPKKRYFVRVDGTVVPAEETAPL